MKMPEWKGRYGYFAALAFAGVLPLATGRLDHLNIATLISVYVILALGLNIITGFCGLLALGFAAFYGIGAYITALCCNWLALPLLLAAVMLGTAFFGFLCGAPVLRLRGDYLAIATLGFGEITRIIFNNFDALTHGPKGISNVIPKSFFFIDLSNSWQLYYFALLAIALQVMILLRLNTSRIGRAWVAIREDEVAASCSGINVMRLKLFAFMLGSVFAGLAGFIFAAKEQFVSPESFTFLESAMLVCMIVIGGIGSIPGVITGAVTMVLLPEAIREFLPGFEKYRMLFFVMLLIGIMLFRPQGIFYNRRRMAELLPASEAIREEEDDSLFDERRK
jgi:branched-chain amino acid transport system permease protein